MSMALEVSQLAVQRGGVAVLSGVSFTVRAGEALILRGPNGSGKTTLLRTIAGLQPALAGSVRAAEGAIAYAAHADGVKAVLTVAENLRFWAGIYGTGPIDGALCAFDLTALSDRPAHALSPGDRSGRWTSRQSRWTARRLGCLQALFGGIWLRGARPSSPRISTLASTLRNST